MKPSKIKETAPVVGTVTSSTGKEVTIANPDGTKTVVPTTPTSTSSAPSAITPRLSMVDGVLTLSTAADPKSQEGQQNAIKPGTKVNIQPKETLNPSGQTKTREAAVDVPRPDVTGVNTTSVTDGDEARQNFVDRIRKLAGL